MEVNNMICPKCNNENSDKLCTACTVLIRLVELIM